MDTNQKLSAANTIDFQWSDHLTGKVFHLQLVPEPMYGHDGDEDDYRQKFEPVPASQVEWYLNVQNADGYWCGDLEPIFSLPSTVSEAVARMNKILDQDLLEWANYIREMESHSDCSSLMRVTSPYTGGKSLWVTWPEYESFDRWNVDEDAWLKLRLSHPCQLGTGRPA